MVSKGKLFLFIFSIVIFSNCGDGENYCREHHPNGQLKSEVPCDGWGGVYEGEMKTWDEEGNLIGKDTYVNHLKEDTSFLYYPKTGNLRAEIPMLNGDREGMARFYHPDGKTISMEIDFYQGAKLGKLRRFREDGSQSLALSYYMDRRHGGFGIFRKSGLPYFTGEFAFDFIEGDLRFFNEEGAVIKSTPWEELLEQYQVESVNLQTLAIPMDEGKAFIKNDSVWLELQ